MLKGCAAHGRDTRPPQAPRTDHRGPRRGDTRAVVTRWLAFAMREQRYVDRDDGRDVGLEMVRAGWADIWFLSVSNVRRRTCPRWRRLSALSMACGVAVAGTSITTAPIRFPYGAFQRCHLSGASTGGSPKSSSRSLGDGVASRAPRVWPVPSLEGGLPPLFGNDGGGFAGSRLRLASGGADSPARPRPRHVQRARRPRVLPCPVDPRCPAKLLGRAESPGPKNRWRSSRLSRLECRPRDGGGGGGSERRCTAGCSPCIPPGPDVDCRGGSGDGPRYVDGPVRVTGSDPYRLDSDGNGVGCE
jgi:hypothetical protein